MIAVTQRTGLVRALSKLMVLKEGRIEAYGPRDEVLQQQMRAATVANGPQTPPQNGPGQLVPNAVSGLPFTTGARFG